MSDLLSLPPNELLQSFTSLFVATGSDYTSYFKNIGKATVLNTFYVLKFYLGVSSQEGSVANFKEEIRNLGFLCFLCLVGTIYFKRHLASFACISQVDTPDQLYHSIDKSLPALEKHNEFIEKICTINGERMTSEDERMPSITALYRHWLQSTYISNLWGGTTQYDVYALLSYLKKVVGC